MTKTDGQITFVLTSCGRFDLLELTLSSFLAYNTAPIAQYIIVEDSGRKEAASIAALLGENVEVLLNDPPLGQMRAIDRAYERVSTPYIFHCEDDWLFFRSGFVEESKILIEKYDNITTVTCRRPGQNEVHDKLFQDVPISTYKGINFRMANLKSDSPWGGYSFNPGLRRSADYQCAEKFSTLGHEHNVSVFFRQLGKSVAALEIPACETSGQERHLFYPIRRWNWISRNRPCGCGSGKKFKRCHGPVR